MILRYGRTEAFRANPDEEVEEEVEEGGGGAEGVDQRGPDRAEAARRVAERQHREQVAAQDRERQETADLRRKWSEAEPKLKILDRLAGAFTEDGSRVDAVPELPDPLDADYARKMAAYLEARDKRNLESWSQQSRFHETVQQQQAREAARLKGNDEVRDAFLAHPDRKDWSSQKAQEFLKFVFDNYRPRGPNGEFTEETLIRAERDMFAEDVAARNQAEGQKEIMRHLGATRKPAVPRKSGTLSPEQIDARAEELVDSFERMSRGKQIRELDRMQNEEPQVYKYFVSTYLRAADSEEDEK